MNPTGLANSMTRRDAIRLGAAGLGFAAIVRAQNQVPNWKTEMRQLAPNVYAYIQGGGPGEMNQGVSNGGIVVGENSILVIDSLGAPIQTKNFIAAIRKVAPNKPMSRMVISHHHGDHIMGLPFFPQPMEIVCHEYCRKEMLATTFPTPTWEKRANWAEGGEPRVIIPPTTTIDDRTTYYYGNTEVHVITKAPVRGRYRILLRRAVLPQRRSHEMDGPRRRHSRHGCADDYPRTRTHRWEERSRGDERVSGGF